MSRDLPIGNGSLLVNFDRRYTLRDVYFPRVGRDNNTIGHPCRVGLWADGWFSWLHDEGWEQRLLYEPDTLVTDVRLHHRDGGFSLECHDAVHPEATVLLRSFTITNHHDAPREVRLLFCQDFHIHETADGDTAYYEPVNDVVIHYKFRRYFLVNGRSEDGAGIFQYTTGVKEIGPWEGTWRDAEDGVLEKNPIAQGSVDSVISLRQTIPARGVVTFTYWIAAGRDFFEVKRLNQWVLAQEPRTLIDATRRHWREWVRRSEPDLGDLPECLEDLYYRSLLIIRTQIDNSGAIIAANDADSAGFHRDTYSYMWPRDGAMVAHALDRAGYHDLTRHFFTFCASLMPEPTYYPEGYLLHKYNPDGSLGSSWHPWIRDGKPSLPIQEDGIALVLWALWEHQRRSDSRIFVKSLYARMIRPAAKFMLTYRYSHLGLPCESYDLWEERYGIHTFTTAAVCAGLKAGAKFAGLFHDEEMERLCREGYACMRKALLTHLYRPELRRFARTIVLHSDRATPDIDSVDPTVDSSLFAPFAFGLLPSNAPQVVNTMQAVEERLWVKTDVGGVARYERDDFHRCSHSVGEVVGNPWFNCTLWLAQWWIALAKRREDLARPRRILEWVAEHALPSGVIAEQLHPYTGEPLSVSPLTWSHATYVETLLQYGEKYREVA